jgi:hypothetical protein
MIGCLHACEIMLDVNRATTTLFIHTISHKTFGFNHFFRGIADRRVNGHFRMA